MAGEEWKLEVARVNVCLCIVNSSEISRRSLLRDTTGELKQATIYVECYVLSTMMVRFPLTLRSPTITHHIYLIIKRAVLTTPCENSDKDRGSAHHNNEYQQSPQLLPKVPRKPGISMKKAHSRTLPVVQIGATLCAAV